MHIPDSNARRLVVVALALATTMVATWVYQFGLGHRFHPTWLSWSLIGLFTLLTAGLAQGFWSCTLGFIDLLWRGRERDPDPPDVDTGRCAVVMPIYNEDPRQVMANLHTLWVDLQARPEAHRFDLFILSDSTDPERWVREVAAWDRLVQALGGEGRIHYRHRADNSERKTGNIADFLTRWGSRYQWCVVLDADSVMSGDTLVRLVGRIAASPKTALIQSNPLPVGRTSLWARLQQFATALYGPVSARGLRLWAQGEGTYFGHNAVIRVSAFLAECGLGHLPGKAPLGGAVLSHDFVEAALLVRAGWRVEFHDDLDGSYEECPTTLLDFAKRDRRWCQGNLQHAWVIFQPGLHWVSRMHLFLGIMAYAGSPLWVLFLILSVAHAAGSGSLNGFGTGPMEWQLALFLATAAALVLPKAYGLVAAVIHRPARRGFGGICRLAMSAAVETVMAVLVAPVMMLYHARFVIETLTGIKVQWNAQSRDEQATDWGMLFAEHLQHLVAGILLFAVAWTLAPWLLWWLSPVWLPLLMAVPVAAALGSAVVGQRLRRAGLLLIPEERTPAALLVRKQVLVADGTYAMREWDDRDGLALAIVDPRLNHLHSQVQESTQDKPWHADRDLVAQVERDGVAGLARTQRVALLRDPDAMRRLHRAAWSVWPRERLEAALGGPLPATG